LKINIDIDKTFNIGDNVIILNEIDNGYCLFLAGHKFKIDKIDKAYDKYHLIDKDNDRLVIYGYFPISKEISINDAKKKYKNQIEYVFFVNFFNSNCPYKKEEYDHRDIYDVCIKQPINTYSCKICTPSNSCIKYYKDFSKKNIKITQYIRKYKLKNII